MGEIGDLGPQGSIIFGIFVGLASTSVQSLGLTLQRKSHILEDEKSVEDSPRPPYRRRRWQLGMAMFIISNIVGSTIQITTLPLPVLSALQASGLVFNSVCATLILKEPFTRYSLAGTFLVSIGAVLIATFGAIGEPAHSLSQLLRLFERAEFLAWILATCFFVGGAAVGSHILKSRINNPQTRLLRGMAYGFISGVLSAHSLLLAKSAVELLVRTIVDHVNQFNRWQSWAILLGLISLALGQLYFLHRGLKLCSTSILYPFVFCIYNIIAILDGLIYFNQASRLPKAHIVLIIIGTLILLSGVICLSWRLNAEARTTPMAADLADIAYQLDSDASSVSSLLESPSERTGLLTKIPTSRASNSPIHPRPETVDLESAPGIARSGALSPDPPRRSVHWDRADEPSPQPTASPRHHRGSMSPSATRLRSLSRRQVVAEADALWDELQDEPSPTPLSGQSALDSDGRTPSPFGSRHRSRALTWQENRPSRLAPSPCLESPRGGRGSPLGDSGRFSPGPLMRSGTGRSYRDRRPRGSSLHGYGALGRTASWSSSMGEDSEQSTSNIGRKMSRMWRMALGAVSETVGESGRRRNSRSNNRGAGRTTNRDVEPGDMESGSGG